MGVSILLRLFISSNEVCNTAYVLLFKDTTMGPMIPKEMKYNLHSGKKNENVSLLYPAILKNFVVSSFP